MGLYSYEYSIRRPPPRRTGLKRWRKVPLHDVLTKCLLRVATILGESTPPLIHSRRIPNAQVDMRGRIIYNAAFMRSLIRLDRSLLLVIAVLAHEMGHIIHDHVNDVVTSPYQKELQADEIAGCVIGKLCKSSHQFEQVIGALSGIGKATHPPAVFRMKAIRRGRDNCSRFCIVY